MLPAQKIHLLICLMFLLGLPSQAFAKAQAVKLDVPARVVWMVQAKVDEDNFSADTTQAWKNYLEELNFRFLPFSENNLLVEECKKETGAFDEMCTRISSANSDIFITGKMLAQKQKTGPTGPKVGLKVNIILKAYRTDSRMKLFEIRQSPYGTGANNEEAFFNALKKVKIPVAIQLSNLVKVHFSREMEGLVKINGFTNTSEREDPLTSLRFIKGVNSLIMEETTKDSATFRIGFSGTTWGGLIYLMNTTQGSGVIAKVTEDLKAEAQYDIARAFRLLTSVTTVESAPQTGYYGEKLDEVAKELDRALDFIDYMVMVEFPVRLTNVPSKARKEMRLAYGGDIVLIPRVIREKDQTTLLVEVWSTFAGKLFSADAPIVKNRISDTARKTIFQIKEKMLPMLKRRRGKLPALQRKQYDAWIHLMGK